MMDQEPDIGDEPLPPPTPEEERADAWEYWQERAVVAEAHLAVVRRQRDDMTEALNVYITGRQAETKAFHLHVALKRLLKAHKDLIRVTNSEPTFGEAEAITEAERALFDNRLPADWEPAP